MLEHLSVRNYVLIDHLDIDFHSGFTVLTGETGSGKTIMLGALSLLLGAKADRNDVRLGENSAEITGLFSVSSKAVFDWADEHGIEIEDNEILIRRLIKATGKGAYTVNGSPVTVKEGEELFNVSIMKQEKAVLAPTDAMVKRVLKTADFKENKQMVSVREGELIVELCPVPRTCRNEACGQPIPMENISFCPYCGSPV